MNIYVLINGLKYILAYIFFEIKTLFKSQKIHDLKIKGFFLINFLLELN